jgi:serine/threonine protein kinase
LRRLSPHPGIIKLVEVLYEQPTGRLALVFELMDMNIYELIRGRRQYLPEARIKSYMYQLIKAMDHMHRNGIFHRDIKPENILIADDVLKLADFGSCRGIYSKQPYTEYISTRWYRAPECLLTDGYYNYKMDLWGVGCVFFEIVSLYPLFPGTNELDQIHKIHNILGTPPPDVLDKFKKHATHMELNFPVKEGSGESYMSTRALCHPHCVRVPCEGKMFWSPEGCAWLRLRPACWSGLSRLVLGPRALSSAVANSFRPDFVFGAPPHGNFYIQFARSVSIVFFTSFVFFGALSTCPCALLGCHPRVSID